MGQKLYNNTQGTKSVIKSKIYYMHLVLYFNIYYIILTLVTYLRFNYWLGPSFTFKNLILVPDI